MKFDNEYNSPTCFVISDLTLLSFDIESLPSYVDRIVGLTNPPLHIYNSIAIEECKLQPDMSLRNFYISLYDQMSDSQSVNTSRL
jgi:hypothetical protein